MFRKTTGSILCPSCGRITNADAATCFFCGRRRPGMWGFAPALRHVVDLDVTRLITVACIALYVASILLDPIAALRPRGPLDLLSPSGAALLRLGMTGAQPWALGWWWTLITAMYLHGSILHILFNVLWIRQLGPAVQELYGNGRLFVIFTVSGVAGFVLSNVLGVPLTVGASGAIFGLLGAMVAFGRRRGGVFGRMVLRQYGQWALILFLMGFFISNVNNLAHGGGFVGGFLTGLLLEHGEGRSPVGRDHALGVATIGVTILAFAFALYHGFVAS
jgi:rhomboid protease GluP